MDPVKSVQMLKENDSMAEEVVLMYDEIYLQKREYMLTNNAIYTEE